MKKQYYAFFASFALSLVLVATIALPSVVSAQDTTLEQRLETYKTERKIDSKSKEDKLKLRCSIAQANLKNLQTRLNQVQTTRATAYKNISDILNNLQKSLNDQAFETTDLSSVIKTYNAKVADYTNNMKIYKQAVDDAVAVNCVNDPHGFKGALETARLYHEKMVPSITDIRTYVTNTVKTTLVQIKDQLSSGRTTGGLQ